MRSCTRLLAAVAWLAAAHGDFALALTAAKDPPPVTLAEIEEFGTKGIPPEKWPALLEVLGREENGRAARLLVLNQAPFPAAKLVELLSDAKVAVRLGALDLLEENAGDTFGFDPWSEEPAGGANAEALARWREWLAKGAAPHAGASASLSPESFRALAMEIVSGRRDRAERAMARLEEFGPAAIAHLEAMLRDQPSLEEGARASLKAAEYRVVLRGALPRQAAALSRELALGAPEAQAAALPALAEGGLAVLPIIADLLASPDPLVRETAVDAAFKAGEARAVELALPLLRTEKAESVLHALLRNLGANASTPAVTHAIAQFLQHPSENVAISAAEALGVPKGGPVDAALTAALADPRWRVRAAVIETLGKRRAADLAGRVEKMMDDPDQFVRVTAAESYHTLLAERSHDALLARFHKQDELRPAIVQAWLSEEKPPPDELWAILAEAPPATIIECLDALEDRFDHEGKRIVHAGRFAEHRNPDVAAAALRLLASYGRQTGELLRALKSPNPAQRDAVLDQLHLPPGFLEGAAEHDDERPRAPNALDKLYHLFAGQSRPGPAAEASANPGELRKVLEGFLRDGSPRQKFRAAVVLASQGDRPAAAFILANLQTLSGLDRREVAGSLLALSSDATGAGGEPIGPWPSAAVREIMTRLLADPANDVREAAIHAWLAKLTPPRLTGLLAELRRPGTLLKPDDLYGWELDRAAGERAWRAPLLEWSTAILGDPAAPEPNKVFAIILLGRSGQAQAAGVERFLEASNPWLRRAAYRALGLAAVEAHLPALLHDDSAMVRAAIPFLASPHSTGWLHWFDDAHSVVDDEDFRTRDANGGRRAFGAWAGKVASDPTRKVPATDLQQALEKLTRDPSDLVRFESLFALLRLGRPVDAEAMAALVPAQPAETQARYRLGQFLGETHKDLPKSYAPLVPMAQLSEELRSQINAAFGIDPARAPVSFAALAQNVSLPAAPPPVAEPVVFTPAPARPVRVVFFHKAGCRDCDRVRQMLAEQSQRLAGVTIEERDIAEPQSALLDETLSARFHVRDAWHQVTPAVFTQAGALLRDDITFPKLGDLLHHAAALEPDDRWAAAGAVELRVAQTTIAQRYDALSLSVLIASGVLDGLNPCAIATIIFLLSYLQVARRAPGEILAIGIPFCLAVFVTYFVIGLGLAEALARISAFRLAGLILNYALAAFALLLAVLSFRDAMLASRGQVGEMALQLPDALKSRIRGVIRAGARSSRYIAAALVAGVIISLLELACTGQVYLPTIQYMLRSGRAGAAAPLFLYNAAFILPLVTVFVLAFTGMRSDALVEWQKENTALVKALTGLLFLGLTLLLLFTYRPAAGF